MRVERGLDRLFGLPLPEFTSARNALARELKAAHEDAAAAHVRALTKPSVPAWAINQLARSEPAGVRALLDAGDALRKAQKRLLQKTGTSDLLRQAAIEEREAINLLTQQSRTLLESAGRPATTAVLDRVSQTLHVAAVDEEGRRLLKAGRLQSELEPAGFGAFTGFPTEDDTPSPSSAQDELAERRRLNQERQQQKRELQQKARELERDARDAEQKADRAAAAAEEARGIADRARVAADEAAAKLASRTR